MSDSSIFQLPSSIDVQAIRNIVGRWPTSQEVVIRIPRKAFVRPSGLVAIACLIDRARRDRDQTVAVDYAECESVGYWERMGLFRLLGIASPESSGEYHPPAGRFAELAKVGDDNDTDDISKALVDTLELDSAGTEWQCVNHIIGELINNVCHHSSSFGYAHAQYYPANDRVEISIGDSGIGITKALSYNYGEMSDSVAIEKALVPLVTSNPPHFGQPERRNRGVGLTTVHRLVEASHGSLEIWSGGAIWKNKRSNLCTAHWQGTILSVSLCRKQLTGNFSSIMQQIHSEIIDAKRIKDNR